MSSAAAKPTPASRKKCRGCGRHMHFHYRSSLEIGPINIVDARLPTLVKCNVPRWGFGRGTAPDLGLAQTRNGLSGGDAWNNRRSRKLLAMELEEKVMDRSVGQARWLLAPIFALAVTLLVIGISLG